MSKIPYGELKTIDCTAKDADGAEHVIAQLHYAFVVRCSDCKHWTEDEMEYYHYCGNWCEQVEPDGFCAWGERRDA